MNLNNGDKPTCHLQDLREGFLRTVSHELRTPLTSVIGFIELVYFNKEAPLTAQQKTYLKTALSEVRSLKTLIDDLLDITILRSGKTNIDLSSIRLHSFVTKILKSVTPLTRDKEIKLSYLTENESLIAKADKQKLRRIFINLITNAIKFTNSGHIIISVKEEDFRFLFTVSDTGIGIDESDHKIIFEEFAQTDYSITREFEGIGLGLTIVKQLVELHGGQIWVKSKLGEGSSFFFTLPKTNELNTPQS